MGVSGLWDACDPLALRQAKVRRLATDPFEPARWRDGLPGRTSGVSDAKFLESSPISLDAAPRSVGAPLGRILRSVQGRVVLIAGGIGLHIVGGRVTDAASEAASQSLASS